MDKDQEWTEIKSLRTAIEGAAFEKQTFRFEKKAEEESQLYSKKAVDRAWKAFNDRRSEKAIKERGKPIHRLKPGLVYYKEKHSHKKEPRELAFCSRIRIFDPKTKRFVRSVRFKSSLNKTSHLDVFDLAEKVDTFLGELTEKIWRHKQAATPEAGQRLIEDDKERVLRVLKATRGDLERYGYSKKAIREAMQILKRDLDKCLERAREMKDHKYFVKTGPLDHPWIQRKNDLIRDIRSLYKKYTPLSERKIDASIAVIFAATDFWTDDKDEEQGDQAGLDRIAVYFERLRKRKAPEDTEPPELFDPPQNIRSLASDLAHFCQLPSVLEFTSGFSWRVALQRHSPVSSFPSLLPECGGELDRSEPSPSKALDLFLEAIIPVVAATTAPPAANPIIKGACINEAVTAIPTVAPEANELTVVSVFKD